MSYHMKYQIICPRCCAQPTCGIPARREGAGRSAIHVAAEPPDQGESRRDLPLGEAIQKALLSSPYHDIERVEQGAPLGGDEHLDTAGIIAAQYSADKE